MYIYVYEGREKGKGQRERKKGREKGREKGHRGGSKMVITRIKNRSPDMILTAFEGKFDEKKDEIPPGICRPHKVQIIQYWEFEG